MHFISNVNLIKTHYFSVILSLIPISFIAGNMIININIILLILSALIIFRASLFRIEYFLLDKLIFLFFFLILFNGVYNDLQLYINDKKFSDWRGWFETIKKSLFFLKYLLLYLVLRFLIEKKIINLKLFFITCSISSLFVCFDIFYQYKFGQDIFGFKTLGSGRKLGGPFGDELIAGGFIQRFSLFAFFLLPIFFNKKSKKIIKFIIPLLFIIFFSAIIISGNRMPLILFIFGLSALIILQKETRKYISIFVVIFSLAFFLIFKFNSTVQNNFTNFYLQIEGVVKTSILKQNEEINPFSNYSKEFSTFYDTWLMNKYIGGGIKSFRYYCHVRPNIDKNSKFICNMHPHNYYLEILTETGIFGFLIITSIFLIILYISFFKKYFTNSRLKDNHIITPFMFLFLTEIFPIKSTGSFFTTGNATFIFLVIAVIVALARKENLN